MALFKSIYHPYMVEVESSKETNAKEKFCCLKDEFNRMLCRLHFPLLILVRDRVNINLSNVIIIRYVLASCAQRMEKLVNIS